jgi:uncharacterized protein (DUF433 family)
MSYRNIITIEPGKRGGKPCIRRMRITVYDVLGWLAAGMSHAEILDDFPELTEEDIKACLEFAADRERRVIAVVEGIFRAGVETIQEFMSSMSLDCLELY